MTYLIIGVFAYIRPWLSLIGVIIFARLKKRDTLGKEDGAHVSQLRHAESARAVAVMVPVANTKHQQSQWRGCCVGFQHLQACCRWKYVLDADLLHYIDKANVRAKEDWLTAV